jgi:hypothetical protein
MPLETPHARARIDDVFAIVEDSNLSDAAITLWIWYQHQHIDGCGAVVSDDRTLNVLRWSQSTLIRARARFVEAGYLLAVRRGHQPCAYFSLPKSGCGKRSA